MAKTQERDVIELLVEQHDLIKGLFSQLETAQGERKRELFEELIRMLAVHEAAEEEVVHPIAERNIPNGEQIITSRLREEDEMLDALSELYDLGLESPEFDGRLAVLADAVVEHASREEAEEFVQLRERLSRDQLRRMAGALYVAQDTVPTRAHPMAEEAEIELVTGPPMELFERARGAVRDWRESA